MRITLEEDRKKETGEGEPLAYNPTDDELKKLRKARIAEMKPHERLFYYLYYYKVPLIVITAAVIAAVTIVRDIRNNLPIAFCAELYNAFVYDGSEELALDFAAASGIDTSQEDVLISMDTALDWEGNNQADIYAVQRLSVRIAASEIDVLGGTESTFTHYAAQGTFYDLRELLDDDALAFYEPYLVTASVVEEDEEGNEIIRDPAPFGIRLDDAPRLEKLHAYPAGSGVAGIVVNSRHPERAVQFLDYLFARETD